MKIAFVVQRYGVEVVGGAESLARLIAEKLVNEEKISVDVFTTRAIDYRNWKNHFPEGASNLHGVNVFRFTSLLPRIPFLFNFYNTCVSPLLKGWGKNRYLFLSFFSPVLRILESLWFFLQGPYCPKLVSTLQKNATLYEHIFFFTYLYYPTVCGFDIEHKSKILVPTAHDEAPIYFPKIARLFQKAPIFFVSMDEERKILENLIPDKSKIYRRVGLGFDYIKLDADAQNMDASDFYPECKYPYVLYLGRISEGKGVHSLLEMFLKYKKTNRESGIHLILVGAKEEDLVLPKDPNIHYLGFVDEKIKPGLIKRARGVINPSSMESLSMIVVESIALKTPVLVNAKCAVLKSYSQHARSVYTYENQIEFNAAIEFFELPNYKIDNQEILVEAKKWVQDAFSWKRVLDSYKFPTCGANLS